MNKKLINRASMLPAWCDRCGNDFMVGKWIMHLPYIKKYIALCGVCAKGLGISPEIFISTEPSQEVWKAFWEALYGTDVRELKIKKTKETLNV